MVSAGQRPRERSDVKVQKPSTDLTDSFIQENVCKQQSLKLGGRVEETTFRIESKYSEWDLFAIMSNWVDSSADHAVCVLYF